jgi:hypothetical protein
MWCLRCGRLVPVGRYKQAEWGPGFIGGCTAEEAGPEMQRNYMDAHLVHDIWNIMANGIMPGPGDWLYDGEEPPAQPGPEPGPASVFDDVLVDGDEPPAFGEDAP